MTSLSPPDGLIWHLCPPYDEFRGGLDVDTTFRCRARIVCVRVHEWSDEIVSALDFVKKKFPEATAGVWAPSSFPGASIAELIDLGPDLWLSGETRFAQQAEQQLTDVRRLDRRVIRWFGDRGIRMTSPERALWRSAFASNAASTDLNGMVARLGLSARTLRRKLRRSAARCPSGVLRMAKVLLGIVRSQKPSMSLAESAFLAGYGDYSSFYRATRSALGISPSATRGTLGVNWLLDLWWQQRDRSKHEHCIDGQLRPL